MQRYIFMLTLGLFILGCSPQQQSKLLEISTIQSHSELSNPQILGWIEQLTSPKFFEYTQAARNLIERGTEVIPYLCQQSDKFRESNDTLQPVCLILLQIILAQQPDSWLQEQLQTPNLNPKIVEFATAELKRRHKTNVEK